MAFSNVKHKKQSCRTCRACVTQTFVSLYGFSVMFPPLGKERFWTLSFVTVFFFFCCVSTFLILDSGCIVFDVHCTFKEMHCVLYIALFSVSGQAFRHWVDLTSSPSNSPPAQKKKTHTNTHNMCTQILEVHITASDGCQCVANVKHWIWIMYWSISSVRSRCSFYCPTDSWQHSCQNS